MQSKPNRSDSTLAKPQAGSQQAPGPRLVQGGDAVTGIATPCHCEVSKPDHATPVMQHHRSPTYSPDSAGSTRPSPAGVATAAIQQWRPGLARGPLKTLSQVACLVEVASLSSVVAVGGCAGAGAAS